MKQDPYCRIFGCSCHVVSLRCDSTPRGMDSERERIGAYLDVANNNKAKVSAAYLNNKPRGNNNCDNAGLPLVWGRCLILARAPSYHQN